MGSVFSWLGQVQPASFVAEAIFFALLGICLPLAFIFARRAWRRRYFRRRDRRTFEIRLLWPQILNGTIRAETWRFDRLDREIVENVALDRLEVAPPEEAAQLMEFLRASGLLDVRIWEARHLRGWHRQQALVSLGRMRTPEAVPVLAEALDHRDADIRVAALRGLGRTGLPTAAEAILVRAANNTLNVPPAPLQNALLSCCDSCPELLLDWVRKADDSVRPLLARVLAEVAEPVRDEDLLLLASDPLSEVRAAAARALGSAKPPQALTALANLAGDGRWFVRLRAVVAIGELRDPDAMPVLINALCDPNRHVRLRAAAALVRLEGHEEEILRQATQTRDRYALEALVSELERSGHIMNLVNDLLDRTRRDAAKAALLIVVRAGTFRLLLDALVHHPNGRVRVAVARLFALSGQSELLVPLERLEGASTTLRQRRIVRWVLQQLRDRLAAPASEVPA